MGTGITLNCERIELREFSVADVDGVHDFASDPEVVRFVEWGPNTVEDTDRFIADVNTQRVARPRVDYALAATLRATDEVIGSAMLRSLDPSFRVGSLGYALIRRYWGHGYATEIAELLVEFGFGTLGFEQIHATCDPRNTASARVLTRVGMSPIQYLVNHRVIRGVAGDSLVFAIVKSEWS
jgi:RimJ/RimL family protein N-acetyltransferase